MQLSSEITTSPTIKTRILIISDTHCAPLASQQADQNATTPFRAPLPSADLLIHCGDLTMTGQMEEYHQTLDMLKAIDAPVKLVIAGNHDLSLDRDFVFAHRDQDPQDRQPTNMTKAQADARVRAARDLWTAEDGRAKMEAVTFLDEGVHTVALPNGAVANVYASPYTPEFCDWGFPYEKHEDRFNGPGSSLQDAKNIAPYPVPTRGLVDRPIDIVMTHGPPWGRLDKTSREESVGCPHLLRAVMRARPSLCCFGHIHEGWGAERVTWAEGVERVPSEAMTMETWKDGGRAAGVADVEEFAIDRKAAEDRHAVYVDVSDSKGDALRQGKGTLFVNAAIMDVDYQPVNAPFVVDIDLPSGG